MSSTTDLFAEYAAESPRRFGLFLLAFASLFIYLGFVKPLSQAEDGAPSISLSFALFFLAVALTASGLAYLILGARVARILNPPAGASRSPMLIAGLVMGAASFGLFQLFKSYLQNKGYAV